MSNFVSTKECPGVCVPDRIAEYCEAYLTTPSLCKQSSKCCVSLNIYPDELPDNLKIPNGHLQNNTSPRPNTNAVTVRYYFMSQTNWFNLKYVNDSQPRLPAPPRSLVASKHLRHPHDIRPDHRNSHSRRAPTIWSRKRSVAANAWAT